MRGLGVIRSAAVLSQIVDTLCLGRASTSPFRFPYTQVGGPGIGGMAGVGSAAPFFKMQNAGMVGLAGLEALQLGDAATHSLAAYGGAGLQQASMGGMGGGGPGSAGLTMPTYRPMGLGLAGGGGGLYDAYAGGSDQLFGDLGLGGGAGGAGAGGGLDVLGGLQQPVGGGGGGGMAQPLAQSMTLNQNQLAVLNTHLFSVQTVSGAQLHISPGAPGGLRSGGGGVRPRMCVY